MTPGRRGEDTVFYPQDEMTTVLLPVTTGCPWNRCAFCSMYKGVPHRSVPKDEIDMILRHAGTYTERVFLTGADPLAVGFERMHGLLALIRKRLPYCACVASYASVRTLLNYPEEELSRLHDAGLRMLYVGFESGWDEALDRMDKGHRVTDALRAAQTVNRARIPLCAIVLYGIAGAGQGEENARHTAAFLNRIRLKKIITMNLRVFYGTPLFDMVEQGNFVPAANEERLRELETLIANLEPGHPTEFDTTHPTNLVHLQGTLPWDRARLLRFLRSERT